MTERATPRPAGPSVRLRLTLSYAGFLVVTGAVLLAVVWVFLLRYVPDDHLTGTTGFVPNRSDLLRAFTPAATVGVVLLLVVGLAGGWLLAGRMLAPLTRVTDTARAVSQGTLSHRIRLPGRRDELRDLADTFDAMLDRLEAHVLEQQRFAANASHELRTPLAISRTVLALAREDPTRDAAADLERLERVNTRAIELTEALLLLSRAGQDPVGHDPVDLTLLAEDAVETTLALAEARGTALELAAEPAATVGSSPLLQQLVTNLVHNAVVHNLPTDGQVRITTSTTTDGAVLVVENTGPPVDPAVVDTLVEPFQRGAARTRGDGHDSVGLGLALVDRVTRAHGGHLAVRARPTGGLHVTVTLPPAADDRLG